MTGWDVILPFLGPLAPHLSDPDISDILVNGATGVFVEKFGRMEPLRDVALTEKALQIAVRNIARILGDDVGEDRPLLDARLPDGSRVAAVLPPCAVSGTTIAIRKFHGFRYSLDDLLRLGTLTPTVADLLKGAINARETILVSGGTGSGKTTLLNALAGVIPAGERVIVIEDTAEIQLTLPNVVRLEARREQPSLPAVSIRELLRTTLRLRPDRILLGEVRGAEAFDLLQALNTGHAGTLATLHANSAAQALSRFTTCVLLAGIDLPYRALRANLAEAIDWLVHIDRRHGERIVTQVLRLRGYDGNADRFTLEAVYERP